MALSLALLVAGLWAGKAASAGLEHPEPRYRTYVVRPGDTVWAIAQRVAGPEADPRPLVDAIEQRNAIDGTLLAGEVIRVPVSD